MEILKVSNLRKVYHTKNSEILALKDINFSINKGEIVSIVGPSGCGKSTILSILSGIVDKSFGSVIVKDNSNLSYMLQDDALLPFRTILDNCLIGLEIKSMLTEERKNYVLKLLKDYGLEDFIDK